MGLDPFVDRLTALTPQLCRAMMKRESTCLCRGDITVQQLWALEIIHERAPCPQQALLDALQLKASTGTVFMDRLCRQGLVRRDRNPKNRREVLLKLTRKGGDLLAQVRNQRKQAFRILFKPLPASQRRSHLRILESIVRDFSENEGAKT